MTLNLPLLAGGLIAAAGAMLLGVYGGGLISGLDLLTWNFGTTTSPLFEQVPLAFLGGALLLAGVAVAQLGIYQAASGGIVSTAARLMFLLVGVALVGGGALLAHSIGRGYAILQAVTHSVVAPQAGDIHQGLAESLPLLTTGGWLLLPAPLILVAALLAGSDPARKPGATSLPILIPSLGVALGALIGAGAAIGGWLSWRVLGRIFSEPDRIPKPSEIASALQDQLFASLVLAATIIIVAMPVAMSALSMASNEDEGPTAKVERPDDPTAAP